jgi:hypothetical protein
MGKSKNSYNKMKMKIKLKRAFGTQQKAMLRRKFIAINTFI